MINIHKVLKGNIKIYSLIIEGKEYTFLSTQLARSLEEAFAFAKNDFIRKNPNLEERMLGAKIGLFEIKELSELFFESGFAKENIFQKVKADNKEGEKLETKNKDNPNDQKNKFLKFIIDSKSTEILNKNKNLFTDNEIKYVQDKILLSNKEKENKTK